MKLPVSDGLNWAVQVGQRRMDALLALLVSRLPNLSSLILEAGAVEETHMLGMMLTAAVCKGNSHPRLPKFERLSNVTIFPPLPGQIAFNGPREWFRQRNTADILPFLYLPALSSLRAQIDNPHCLEWPSRTKPECLNLRSLDLTDILRRGTINDFLCVATRLETLRWEWWFDPAANNCSGSTMLAYDPEPTFDLDIISSNLGMVRTTLRSLTLSIGCDGGSDFAGLFPDLWIRGSLHSLRDFPQLRNLEVPLSFLVGFERRNGVRLEVWLPANVETLTIIDDPRVVIDVYTWTAEDVLPLVEAWLQLWRTWTPLLKRVTWLLKGTDH